MAKNVLEFLISAKDEATSVIEKIGGVFSALGGKIADVVKSAVNFEFPTLKASTEDAEKLEVQMGQLRAAIDATGGAAGLTAEDIVKMSKDLDEATLGSAEGFRSAALQLLTFKSVGVDAFERTLAAAQDLSSAGFGTVESATVQLGKALENPIQGLTSLTRVGVSFTEEQKKMIESFVRLGDVAGAQNVILAAVEGQVQGIAAAAGGGLAGAVDLVGKRMTDLRETIGGVLLPVFTQLNLVWADVIGAVNATAERLAGPLREASEKAGQALRTLGEGVAAFLSDALQRLGDWIGNLDWASLQQGASNASAKIADLWQRFVDVGQAVKDFSDVVKVAFNGVQIAFNTVLTGVQGLVAGFLEGLAFIERQAAKVGLGTLERSNELKAEAERWKTLAAESAAAIARDAGQAGEALDRLSRNTDAAEAGQKKLAAAAEDTGVELGVINKTLEDYQAIAARANAALEQATRDQAAGKISAADYGAALLDAATAQEDLTAAQERQNALDTTTKIREEKTERIAAVTAINAQISAAEEEIKTLGQGDQARRRALEAERALAEAKGDTATASRLAKTLADDEVIAANRIADAKRKEATLRREALESVRAQIAAGDDLNGSLAGQVGQLEAIAEATEYAAREAEANAAQTMLQAEASGDLVDRLNEEADRHQDLREKIEREREERRKAAAAAREQAQATKENAEAAEKDEEATKKQTRAKNGLGAAMTLLSEAAEREIRQIQAAAFARQLGAKNIQETNEGLTTQSALIRENAASFEQMARSASPVFNALADGFRRSAIVMREYAGQIDSTAARTEELIRKTEDGTVSFRDIARAARAAEGAAALLGEEELAPLRAALDDARNKLIALKDEADSARDAIARLNAEIAAEKGDNETARKLQLELEQRQALAEVERNLEAARASGNRELVALYEQQRGKLNQLYSLKERNLAADLRGEESGKRTKSTLTEIADEAERAGRALGGLGGINLGNLQSQADRLKTSFTDLNAVL
jgi:hypothetical protein